MFRLNSVSTCIAMHCSIRMAKVDRMRNKSQMAVPRKTAGLATSVFTNALLQDLRSLIEQARGRVAQQVNTELVMLNWHIGNRIRKEILRDERAEYGKAVIESLAKQLTMEYGRGYTRAALFRMVQFAERLPNEEIVAALGRQLSWTHFREILPVEDDLKRNFYAEMCSIEGWSVRTLRDKIKRMLFERTAIAKRPRIASPNL